MSQPAAARARTAKPDPTLLSLLEVEDHRDLLLPWLDSRDLSKLMQVNRATRVIEVERLGCRSRVSCFALTTRRRAVQRADAT